MTNLLRSAGTLCALGVFAALAAMPVRADVAAVPACAWSAAAQPAQWAKLLVRDRGGRQMLVKWKQRWEVPGQSVEPDLAPAEFIARMARDYGLRVENVRHVGSLTQHFASGKAPVLMHWFTATYAGGALKRPAVCPDCNDVAWFAARDVAEATPYPSAKIMLGKLAAKPNAFWTATYEVDYARDPPGGAYVEREPFRSPHATVRCDATRSRAKP
jgi:hypothetical protein